MENLATIANGQKPLTIASKLSILMFAEVQATTLEMALVNHLLTSLMTVI